MYLEIDGGLRETLNRPYSGDLNRHDPGSHLHFVSFPCNVAEFSRLQTPAAHDCIDSLDPREKVQRFNIVHVLDARLTSRLEKQASTLWQVSAHISRALVSEEARVNYLSKEIRRIMHARHAYGAAPAETNPPAGSTGSQDGKRRLSDPQPKQGLGLDKQLPESSMHSLEQLLREVYEGMSQQGYKSLRVNGSLLCQVCVFPKHEAPLPPSADQALALTCPKEDLKLELPVDSADIVRTVIDAVSPMLSLGDLMVRLALPLSTLQRVAQHLVFWKKARVVDVFQQQTRVVIAPGVDTAPDSSAAKLFHAFQQRQRAKVPSQKFSEITFSEVVNSFSAGGPLSDAEDRVRRSLSSLDFPQVLEWLVAQGLVVQLAEYYHFLPGRAKENVNRPFRSQLPQVNENIRKRFRPQLTESELLLLAARAADDTEHHFLCKFAVEFARAHQRADTPYFATFIEQNGGNAMLRLLGANSDIFVKYVCRC